MEGKIDAKTLLDYAEFQIFPSQNRYEACVCSGNKVETIASGPLGQLALHLPELKDLFSKGSNAVFKLQPPKNHDGWFTKLTVTRFLHIVGSPDILNTASAIENEINQLEEARNFHLSLYIKDHRHNSGDGETDSCNLNGMAPELKDEDDIVSSDASKNELLRAMDLRLTTLRGELAAAFNRATGATCSPKDITDIVKLSQHFGAIDLRDTLHKFVELNQMGQTVDLPSDKKSHSEINSRNDRIESESNSQVSKSSQSDTPVKYGVSPAKAAQVERQSSTESEESSYSDEEEDRPTVERSRTLIRSASPRRSASPMRRIQIGRSGSRRATALTIKSLTFFPARDRTLTQIDATANSSEEEGSEQPPKISETNVQRMSVQAAISLFESKQRDQTSDIQTRRSTIDASMNKSVLRRWSAGTGENSTQRLPETVSSSSVPMTSNNVEGGEIPKSTVEAKTESDFISRDHNPVETAQVDAIGSRADILVTQREENAEKLTAMAEWNRQKEAELNQMLIKMMKSEPARHRNITPDNNRSPDVPHEQRGGFYDHYKEKRDEKLRGETARKRAEKQAQFRAMQQILNERKAEMASVNTNDVGTKNSLAKPQKSHRSSTQSAKPKKESSKPAVAKKPLSKASPSPAVRKSWPSTPSPRAMGTSPAKTPCGTSSTGTIPNRRKPQPTPSVPQSSPKVERSQQRPKNVKATQINTSKTMKGVTEKKQQPLTKNGKTAKANGQTATGKDCSMVAAKPSLYNKVTKKSSVVPLESKPFLRKGSGIGPGVSPVVIKTKVSSPQPEETLKNSRNLIEAQENVVTDTFEPVSQQQEGDLEAPETHTDLESETQLTSQKCDDTASSEQVPDNGDGNFEREMESELKTETEEELFISPMAWVEKEEHQDLPIPCDESTYQVPSLANVGPAAMLSPRVRHSLSQMLLEEIAETDITEWGNAENPPAMIYQKDEPKGFKRLLKFARKSRADPNLTGWSSPSVFSEGEDDAEESKGLSKKNADNLLRQAALQAKNNDQQNTSLGGGYEKNSAAQSNTGKFSAQSSSHKSHDHISGAASTTKATRSFFSLSAFRGSKPNETKLR
ncbi:unnamed protein product [Camellia sinensis]